MGEQERDQDAGLWKEALDGLVHSVRQTVDLQRRVGRGDLRPTDLSAAYVRFLRSDLAGYGRTIAELTVEYYKALAEAAQIYGERFYEEVGSEGSDVEVSAEDTTEPAIDLSGFVGEEVAASFTLENNDLTPAEVTVESGACRGPDGAAFDAPVRAEPNRVIIPPGESVAVTLRARLEADSFEPGVEYRLPLHVDGPQPATIQVRLRSEAASDAMPTASEQTFRVRCPKCKRTFERTTDSLVLRPHKTPDGAACPERDGRR